MKGANTTRYDEDLEYRRAVIEEQLIYWIKYSLLHENRASWVDYWLSEKRQLELEIEVKKGEVRNG